MSDVKFLVTVDSKKGTAAIKKLDDHVEKLGKTTQRATPGIKGMWKQMAAGFGVAYGVTKSIRGLVRWTDDAIKKAAIQEEAEMDLQAALESTGREVGSLSRHFREYAADLQKATTFGDEQIINAQALLIQLTNLDKQGLDAATRGALGLATVYKQDLQAATTLVGKALAGNYGALSRYGIMVERTASDEEKRASIMEQLDIMYGRAEAKTETYAGKVAQLSNVYGDLKEYIAAAVIENEAILDIIEKVKTSMSDFIEKAKLNQQIKAFETLYETTGRWSSIAEALASEVRKQTGDWKDQNKVLKVLNDIWNTFNGSSRETITAIAEGSEEIEGMTEYSDKLREAIWKLYGKELLMVGLVNVHKEALKDLNLEFEEQLALYEKMKRIRERGPLLEMPEFEIPELVKSPKELLKDMGFTDLGPEFEYQWGIFEASYDEKVNEWLNKEVADVSRVRTQVEPLAKDSVKMFANLGEQQQAFWTDMVLSMEGGIKSVLNTLKSWAIAEAVKWIFASIPFPASLFMAGGAVTAISALYKAIPSAATGADVVREGLVHVHPGEVIRQPATLKETFREVIREGGTHTNIYLTVNTKEVSADKIFRAVEDGLRKRGMKWQT